MTGWGGNLAGMGLPWVLALEFVRGGIMVYNGAQQGEVPEWLIGAAC